MARKIWLLAGVLAVLVVLVVMSVTFGLLVWLWPTREDEAVPPVVLVVPEETTVPTVVPDAPLPPPVTLTERAVQVENKAEAKVAEQPWVPAVAPEHEVRAEYAGFLYAMKADFQHTGMWKNRR